MWSIISGFVKWRIMYWKDSDTMQNVWTVSMPLFTEHQKLVCIQIAYCVWLARPETPVGGLSRRANAYVGGKKMKTDQGLQMLRVLRVLLDIEKRLEGAHSGQTLGKKGSWVIVPGGSLSCAYNVEMSDPASTEPRPNLVSEFIFMWSTSSGKKETRAKGGQGLVPFRWRCNL